MGAGVALLMYRMIVPKDNAWNTIVVPSTTLVSVRPSVHPATMVLLRDGSRHPSVHAAAGSRPSSPSGHVPSPSRRAAGQPPRPWRCAGSSSSSSPAYVRAVLLPWLWPSPSLSCTGYICMSLRMLRMEARWGATCARRLPIFAFTNAAREVVMHSNA